jgi:hypothetical protein
LPSADFGDFLAGGFFMSARVDFSAVCDAVPNQECLAFLTTLNIWPAFTNESAAFTAWNTWPGKTDLNRITQLVARSRQFRGGVKKNPYICPNFKT